MNCFRCPLRGIAEIPLEVLNAHLLGSGVMLSIISLPFGEHEGAEYSISAIRSGTFS